MITIFFVVDVFSQKKEEYDSLIIKQDACLTSDSTLWVTLSKTVREYQFNDVLTKKMETDIQSCFRSVPNSCYVMKPHTSVENCYVITSELDFPIETGNSLVGVVFIHFVPVFLSNMDIVDTILLTETSRKINFKRITTNQPYIPCFITDTFPYQFSYNEKNGKQYCLVLNSCIQHKTTVGAETNNTKRKKKKCK